ncbi:MAG: macro domain-containing protein [Phycisphaerae bacterium]|jgi:O-acetyl-ADP-ribose deacetylase (regulator of RNase III)
MADIREQVGNLFASPTQTLVNTVNTMGVMGRGIALEFRFRFPAMFAEYERQCQAGRLQIGDLLVWKASTPWVVNFPTKTDWKLPSRYEYVEAGLRRFAAIYAAEQITSVAFPPLGASLGGLDWDRVRDLMYRHLSPLANLSVTIIRYDERAGDRWFDLLVEETRGWTGSDFNQTLGLSKPQAALVAEALSSGALCQMAQLQSIKGLGEKSLERLYGFVRSRLEGGPAASTGLFDQRD